MRFFSFFLAFSRFFPFFGVSENFGSNSYTNITVFMMTVGDYIRGGISFIIASSTMRVFVLRVMHEQLPSRAICSYAMCDTRVGCSANCRCGVLCVLYVMLGISVSIHAALRCFGRHVCFV